MFTKASGGERTANFFCIKSNSWIAINKQTASNFDKSCKDEDPQCGLRLNREKPRTP